MRALLAEIGIIVRNTELAYVRVHCNTTLVKATGLGLEHLFVITMCPIEGCMPPTE